MVQTAMATLLIRYTRRYWTATAQVTKRRLLICANKSCAIFGKPVSKKVTR